MNLFYQPLIASGVTHLDPEESRHCIKVLRRRAGDSIRIVDGSGGFYDAVITDPNSRECHFRVDSKTVESPRNFRIQIAISPTKNVDRIEWFVEKAVEFGIDRITLMECDHSERTSLKIDRLQRVAISAMKQSLKATLPLIDGILPFESVVTKATGQRYIAHVDASNPRHLKTAIPGEPYVVLIGPEGDFSEMELEKARKNDFIKVSLGSNRLRTETAAIAACHILNLINS